MLDGKCRYKVGWEDCCEPKQGGLGLRNVLSGIMRLYCTSYDI